MILRIRKEGEKILREKSKEISLSDPKLFDYIENIKDTLNSSTGVGLAAPQVGIPYRIFIVKYNFQEHVYINPEIIEGIGTSINYEGCLSVPNRGGSVRRDEIIKIKYYDKNLKLKRKMVSSYKSIIIQHEYDHLNGILFIDKLKNNSKDMKHLKIYEEYKVPYEDIPLNGLKVTVNGSDFVVEGDYDGGEKAVMYDNDGSGYPGDGSGYDITKLYGYNENGDEYIIYDIENINKLKTYKEKTEYDKWVNSHLNDEYGVTLVDIELSVIEDIEN